MDASHRLGLIVIAAALWAGPIGIGARQPAYDLLIPGGRIVDGTGNPWFEEVFASMLKDPATRQKIKQDRDFQTWVHEHGSWEGIVLGRARLPQNKKYEGMRISQIAKLRGETDPAETCLELFDPAAVGETNSFDKPKSYPAGIPYTIVNGVVVIDGGRHTGARPGRPLFGRGYVHH